MKRYKRICLLLGILAVACVATVCVIRSEERREQIRNSDEIILELPGDSVQSLSWEYQDASLAFHKDEIWLYDEDEAFPVEEEKIAELLEQFESFGVSFVIEGVADYSPYGLDDPVCTIRLETDEASYEILLGDYSKMDEERYVSIGDGNVYLVKNDPLDYFDTTLSDMIDHDEVPSLDQAAQIRFSGAEEYTITYERDSGNSCCADDVYFTERDGSVLPLDTSLVERYLSDISYLSLTDYATYHATEEELSGYGLDDPELTVTVDYSYETEEGAQASDRFILHVSRDPEEREKGENDEITAYARVGESQIVYRISATDYQNLMAASYDDLRHPEVLTADFGDITQIDIALEGGDYTITAQGENDDQVWLYQDEELEISDFRNALKALTADSFTDQQPTEKEEIGLTVHLDNENFPEVRIELYRYDGTNCLAVVDGQTVSFVNRSYVVGLMEAVNAIVLN